MTRSNTNPGLTFFAAFVAFNTLLLIALGGLVTSKEAGMAVPDWPTTYGQNMFLFPPSLWKGGILYEHTHRLFASWVGLLTVCLGIWLWRGDSRRWIHRLGFIAIGLVIFQGILGGLRVRLMMDKIGIFHAGLAQGFFVLLCAIALFRTRRWQMLQPVGLSRRPYALLSAAAGLIFIQLLIGATMRHEHAGLAVPDFPLAYGRLWPATDAETLHRINLAHADVTITPFQIYIHMVHRIGALAILIASAVITRRVLRDTGPGSALGKGTVIWQCLIVAQAILGASTVWTGRAEDIATLHVVFGASCLGLTVLLALMASKLSQAIPTGGSMRPAAERVDVKRETRPMASAS